MGQISKKTYTICTIILITLICIISYSTLNYKVAIAMDSKKEHLNTFSKTVKDLLKEENIELGKNDRVLPGLNVKLQDDMEITVKRAFKVKLNLDGASKEIITTENDVKNLLKNQNVLLSDMDKVVPSLDDNIKEGDEITVTRISEKTEIANEQIPFTIQIAYDDSLELGKIEKVLAGAYGQKEITYKITYKDGKEASKVIMSEKVITNPTNEIVKKGTKNFIVTSRGEIRRFKKSIVVSASAYTAGPESTGKRPGDRGYGKTSLGTQVRHGVIAVDPKIIPLKSQLYIESLDMIATAEDTGGAIKGNKIDIYMNELSRAQNFGRRSVKIYLLE